MAATASDETTSLIDEGETERYDDAESVNNDENQSEPRRQVSQEYCRHGAQEWSLFCHSE